MHRFPSAILPAEDRYIYINLFVCKTVIKQYCLQWPLTEWVQIRRVGGTFSILCRAGLQEPCNVLWYYYQRLLVNGLSMCALFAFPFPIKLLTLSSPLGLAAQSASLSLLSLSDLFFFYPVRALCLLDLSACQQGHCPKLRAEASILIHNHHSLHSYAVLHESFGTEFFQEARQG